LRTTPRHHMLLCVLTRHSHTVPIQGFTTCCATLHARHQDTTCSCACLLGICTLCLARDLRLGVPHCTHDTTTPHTPVRIYSAYAHCASQGFTICCATLHARHHDTTCSCACLLGICTLCQPGIYNLLCHTLRTTPPHHILLCVFTRHLHTVPARDLQLVVPHLTHDTTCSCACLLSICTLCLARDLRLVVPHLRTTPQHHILLCVFTRHLHTVPGQGFKHALLVLRTGLDSQHPHALVRVFSAGGCAFFHYLCFYSILKCTRSPFYFKIHEKPNLKSTRSPS